MDSGNKNEVKNVQQRSSKVSVKQEPARPSNISRLSQASQPGNRRLTVESTQGRLSRFDDLLPDLKNLETEDSRQTTLERIRRRLEERAYIEPSVIDQLINAPEIYACLDLPTVDEKEAPEVNIAVDILTICMQNLQVDSESERICRQLEIALTHWHTRVRAIALKVLLDTIQAQSGRPSTGISQEENIFHIFESLEKQENVCGVTAMNILMMALETRVKDMTINEALHRMLNKGPFVRLRVYRLAVNLAIRSPDNIATVEVLLDSAIGELEKANIPLQGEILEVLAGLAVCEHGIDYLEKRDVFGYINAKLSQMKEHPEYQELLCSIYILIGKIAKKQPQKCICYSVVVDSLFEQLYSNNIYILPVAFTTFVNMTSTQQSKLQLEANYSKQLRKMFEAFPKNFDKFSPEMKINALHQMQKIFTVESPSPAVVNLLRSWFVAITGPQHMLFIFDIIRQPYPGLRLAALKFTETICQYPWAIEIINSTPGFVQNLLQRKFELYVDVKHAKYNIVKILVKSKIFDDATLLEMKTNIEEGP